MTPIAISIFVLFALMGIPLAVGSALGVMGGILITGKMPLNLVVQRMFLSVNSGPFLAIPLFIFCGSLMNTSTITLRIFALARALVGHITGGLAHANVVASLIFAGMTGSAAADAGGLGQVEIEAMQKQGYGLGFSAAVTAASSTIGPVIPPSIPFIFYASLAEQSVGRLFLGGIVPGFLMGGALMVAIYIISVRNDYPKDKRASLGEITTAFKQALMPMFTPIIILGGMASGIFTVTEAAAVAVLYAFILGVVIYRDIKLRQIPQLLIRTMGISAVMLFILATISSVAWILVFEQVTARLADFILGITQVRWQILLCINIFLLLLGTVLESLPIKILTIPILLPIIESAGIDPIHFGVIMTLNCLIGGITPPVGMLLFITSQVCDVKLETLMRSILPFVIPLLVILLLITYIPSLCMTIPNFLMGVY